MTVAVSRITFLNTTYSEVERELLAGKTPAEVSDLLAEPVRNVMGVWTDLRDAGRVEARNFTQQAGPRPTPPPRHVPDPALAQRVADTTDLLVRAADIDNKRIQAALGRARKAMTDLAGLVADWDAKGRLRAEIAKHEAQIRVLKAELNGSPKAADHSADGEGNGKKPLSEAQLASLAKMRERASQPVDCPACGVTLGSKAGLSAHQRGGKCTGTAA